MEPAMVVRERHRFDVNQVNSHNFQFNNVASVEFLEDYRERSETAGSWPPSPTWQTMTSASTGWSLPGRTLVLTTAVSSGSGSSVLGSGSKYVSTTGCPPGTDNSSI